MPSALLPFNVESMKFRAALLEAWQRGNYRKLKKSHASGYLKKILVKKARERRGTRFFGEAFVAAELCKGDGWYSSYKWLTSSRWVRGTRINDDFERKFAKALRDRFRTKDIESLQRAAKKLYRRHRKDLDGKKPVAPDLWLVIKGQDHFIECKLPHDTLAPHQLAGLALIARHLPNVRVKVVELRQDPADLKKLFDRFYRAAQ